MSKPYSLRRHRAFILCCSVVILLSAAVIAGSAAVIVKTVRSGGVGSPSHGASLSEEASSEKKKDEPVKKIATAKVVNTGDIMVHSTQLDGAKTSDGGYDFSAFFKSAAPYFKAADLAIGNLEVTFGGTQSGRYSGYPAFNTPDSLADVIKNAGFGLLLTSNNHCYDTGLFGVKRTVQVLKEKQIPFVGTRETPDEPNYTVRDVNGIRIGIADFTYETKCDTAGRKALNGNVISSEANDLICSFSYEHIEDFYTEAASMIDAMRKDKADCIVFYLHWGQEYQLKENTWQRDMAQRLCNLGVNVIVGSHPHVVQPVALLHSDDSQNTTVCLYSTGNAVSNQRQELMSPECTTGHTEDGVLFYYTFDKYSDGTTVLSAVDLIPTWVNKYRGGSGYQYQVYPLELPTDGATKYGLTGAAATKAEKSYHRTKETVGAGLTECQTALGCEIRFGQ